MTNAAILLNIMEVEPKKEHIFQQQITVQNEIFFWNSFLYQK